MDASSKPPPQPQISWGVFTEQETYETSYASGSRYAAEATDIRTNRHIDKQADSIIALSPHFCKRERVLNNLHPVGQKSARFNPRTLPTVKNN